MNLVDFQKHIVQTDEDLCGNQYNNGPLQSVRLLVLHQLQEVLQVLLDQLQLVLDGVESRLQAVRTTMRLMSAVRTGEETC